MAIKTFTTGEVLTAADTNTYLNNGGLVYVTSGTQSGTTALNVDGCFTSTYQNYRIILNAIQVSTAARALRLQFRAGGVTNANMFYDYAYNGYRANGTTNNTGLAAQSFAEIGTYIDTFANATLGACTIDVLNPQVTDRTMSLVIAQGYEGAYAYRSGGFVQGEAVSFDGFRITLSGTGNVGFNYTVYGYRKA
jgi:hypothetical protein